MRGPLEFIGDMYDYHYQYYRWFLHRRLLFSELKAEDIKESIQYNIFAHDDRENVGKLITQTTLTGLSAGVGFGSLKYSLDVAARGVKASKALPKALGAVVVGTAIGLAYGSSVNFSANFRGKSDYANHAIGALISFPLSGAFAKGSKLQWGMTNAVIGALLVAYLKTAHTGRFIELHESKQLEKVHSGVFSYHYKPK